MKRILLIAGTHGDEPSGPHAVLSLLQDDRFLASLGGIELTVLPLVNPSGFLAGTRENKDGENLNQWFFDRTKKETPREVRAIKQELRNEKYDLAVSLHEDLWRKEFYLYDTNNGRKHKTIQAIFRSVGVPLYTGLDDDNTTNPSAGNHVVRGYVQIKRNNVPSLEDYLFRNGIAKRVIALEFPGKLSLSKKIALVKKVVKIIIEKEKRKN